MRQNEHIIMTIVYGKNVQIMTIVYDTKWTDNSNSIWDKMNIL